MKDQFHIEGMPSSAGYIGWIGTFEGKLDSEKYMKSESLLVEQLKSLGAIPIGKVSVDQGEIMASPCADMKLDHTRNWNLGESNKAHWVYLQPRISQTF